MEGRMDSSERSDYCVTYTAEQVLKASEDYFKEDKLAASAFVNKYALRETENGVSQFLELTPHDMHDRLTDEFLRVEYTYPKPRLSYDGVRDALNYFGKIVPQGSPMYGIGNKSAFISLSNCVVVDSPKDSWSGISETGKDLGNLYKRRCGVGLDISSLRPDGAKVSNAALSTSGAWSFADFFSYVTRLIAQNGRRGALMITMDVRHPDIEKFIVMKRDLTKVTGANVSVFITDDFMKAVQNDEEWCLQWPIDVPREKALYTHIVKAKALWRSINESAHASAEPGLIFIDNYRRNLPADFYPAFRSVSVNPCCFSKNKPVWVHTKAGIKEIKTITSKDEIWVDSEEVWAKTSGYVDAGLAETFEVTFSNGAILRVTENHKFERITTHNHVVSRELVPLKYISHGDRIAVPKSDGDSTEVVMINNGGREAVGCIEVEGYHSFTANGVISGNSEILLSPYDSCRLISLNLKGFVKNPFKDNAYLDGEEFDKHVRIAMRMMDNLVDLELECIERIIEKVDDQDEKDLWRKLWTAGRDGRRTGLGTHGLGDTLACLGLRYDSEEAIAAVDEIYELLRNSAYDESVNMAIERGPFPAFDWETEKNCAFIQRLPEDLKQKMEKHGRRNIALLTIAPTGTVSLMSQVSSGVEPVFMPFYTRRKKINANDTDSRVDFVDDMGDKWMHFIVFHPNVSAYLQQERPAVWVECQKLIEDPKNTDKVNRLLKETLPDYFCWSEDIDPSRRVVIQGTAQGYIDHGISSTLNFPKDTSVETVEKVYEEAWAAGLKGVTVYVDGSRSGVLVKEEENKGKIVRTDAPKREEALPCDIHHTTVKGKKWVVFVGLMDNHPYEVFGGTADHVDIPKNISSGVIYKIKGAEANKKGRTSRYNLALENGEEKETLIVEDIVSTFDDEDYAYATRLISTSLRHGTPIEYLADQLGRDVNGGMNSFSKVISRVLKKYIKQSAKSGENCTECGDKLVYRDGCSICPSCGNTKCS